MFFEPAPFWLDEIFLLPPETSLRTRPLSVAPNAIFFEKSLEGLRLSSRAFRVTSLVPILSIATSFKVAFPLSMMVGFFFSVKWIERFVSRFPFLSLSPIMSGM